MTKKYIDAERIKAYIKEKQNEFEACNYYLDNSEEAVGYYSALLDFEQLVSSLQQEQPEVDLEKEIKNYLATKCAADDEPCVSEVARHFYELGFNARKE